MILADSKSKFTNPCDSPVKSPDISPVTTKMFRLFFIRHLYLFHCEQVFLKPKILPYSSIVTHPGFFPSPFGKFSQIREKGNVLRIKTHCAKTKSKNFLTADARRLTQMGNGINAEALRRQRNAKREGGARHEFHEGAIIWQNVGVNWTAAGQRLYGNGTKLWTDSFTGYVAGHAMAA